MPFTEETRSWDMRQVGDQAEVERGLRAFRSALGTYPTGVAVVTSQDPHGRCCGVTVNSFSSVSLSPPLVLWSLKRASPSYSVFMKAGFFAVNILGADQQSLSARFSTPAEDKFAGLRFAEGLGRAPVLQGCVASFECRTETTCDGGDHAIFIGRVLRWTVDTGEPLLFYGGRYARMGAEVEAARTEL